MCFGSEFEVLGRVRERESFVVFKGPGLQMGLGFVERKGGLNQNTKNELGCC